MVDGRCWRRMVTAIMISWALDHYTKHKQGAKSEAELSHFMPRADDSAISVTSDQHMCHYSDLELRWQRGRLERTPVGPCPDLLVHDLLMKF